MQLIIVSTWNFFTWLVAFSVLIYFTYNKILSILLLFLKVCKCMPVCAYMCVWTVRPASLSLFATDRQVCVCVWLRADVSQWSGKLQQTYSCRLTLWLIWSVISPVFHFNRCDHSAVAGLSDLIKINSGVTGLPTEHTPPLPNPWVSSAWKNPRRSHQSAPANPAAR